MSAKERLVDYIRESTGVSKNKSNEVVRGIFDTIMNETKENGEFGIVGFGTFKVKERAARKGRNPQTGEEMTIPATKAVTFHAGKPFKESVK